MMLVPVPGYGAGRLDVDGNFAHYVDRIVLGRHNYESTVTWDPEGIVSTLPAIATVLLGTLAGDVMAAGRSMGQSPSVAAAGRRGAHRGRSDLEPLAADQQEALDQLVRPLHGRPRFRAVRRFAWVVDVRGWQRPVRPFVILGMNAIAVYMVSELLETQLRVMRWRDAIYGRVFAPLASPINASLLYALAYTSLMFVVAWVLYRRQWFLKV